MPSNKEKSPRVLIEVTNTGYDDEREEAWAQVMVDRRWIINARFSEDHRGAPNEVKIYSETFPELPLTSRSLRSIPFGAVFTAAIKAVSDRTFENPPSWPPIVDNEVPESFLDAVSKPGPGRPSRSDLYFAALAALYVACLDQPKPKEAIAGALAISPSTAGNRIHEARRRVLLTSAGQGRAGGGLTDRAIALLRDQKVRQTSREQLIKLLRKDGTK